MPFLYLLLFVSLIAFLQLFSLIICRYIIVANIVVDLGQGHSVSGVEFWHLKVVNPMSYLTVGSLENTSRLVDVSLNWTINSTG